MLFFQQVEPIKATVLASFQTLRHAHASAKPIFCGTNGTNFSSGWTIHVIIYGICAAAMRARSAARCEIDKQAAAARCARAICVKKCTSYTCYCESQRKVGSARCAMRARCVRAAQHAGKYFFLICVSHTGTTWARGRAQMHLYCTL